MHAEEPPTLESNLEYRLAKGALAELGEIVPAPAESRRALRIAEGGEGHRHPRSSIGCRERSSPSMHAVFYLGPGHTRETWVHFDLHGPQNVAGHLSEVMRNRMPFGRTSEYEVYRGRVRCGE